jgi:hypothetical protein
VSLGAFVDTDFGEVSVTIAWSNGANDKAFASYFGDFLRDAPEAIDLKDALDLGSQPQSCSCHDWDET